MRFRIEALDIIAKQVRMARTNHLTKMILNRPEKEMHLVLCEIVAHLDAQGIGSVALSFMWTEYV